MSRHRMLLDAFAEARRTWDDLIALQTDVKVGSGHLDKTDLSELEQRAEAHRVAVEYLADMVAGEPADETSGRRASAGPTGISNRESAADEAAERQNHPPLDTSSPLPQDAAGRTGEQPLRNSRDRHTSHKAGSRSIAQKEAESRYPDRPTPSSRKVAGAFGKEQR